MGEHRQCVNVPDRVPVEVAERLQLVVDKVLVGTAERVELAVGVLGEVKDPVELVAAGSRPSRWWKNGLAKRWPKVRPPWVEVWPDRRRSAAV